MKSLVQRVPLAVVATVSLAAIAVTALVFGPTSEPARAADDAIEVWWPTEGATVSDTQSFKALLTGRDVSQYRMYWQIDGTRHEMANSYEDYPHKEDLVDLSKWPGEGSYAVNFTATNRGRKTLAERTVTIEVVQSQAPSAPSHQISVWWPSDGGEVSGVQPFKAVLDGYELADYEMYWQVDGGQLHLMVDSPVAYPHKEAEVDVSDWTWSDSGPYQVTFVAESPGGERLATKSISLFVATGQSDPTTTTTTPSKTTTAAPSTTTTAAPSTTTTTKPQASGLVGATLYVDPWSPAKQQADAWRDSQPYEASLLDKIAEQPTARWFGDSNGDIFAAVDQATDTITAAGALPVYVSYNIPVRDCSGYSAGGAKSADEYRTWVRSFAEGIGGRSAAVILEPDALALLDCLSEELRIERLELLQGAIETLGAGGSTAVYLDAGHARWHSPEETARRLKAAGVSGARGFSLNVSNFVGTEETVTYGEKVSALLGGKTFIVDSSRNGLGPSPDGEWCNPPGRALGLPPTTSTGKSAVDAYLWVKIPGESDGTCDGGPAAGEFWPDYAVGLAERADW